MRCRHHNWKAVALTANDTEPTVRWQCTLCHQHVWATPGTLLSDQAEREALQHRVVGLQAECRQAWRTLYMACTNAEGHVSLPGATDAQVFTLGQVIGQLSAAAGKDKGNNPVVRWAVERWNAEVANRPLVNVHRRSLDDAWRQVVEHFGGNANDLLGPSHDVLLQLQEDSKNE